METPMGESSGATPLIAIDAVAIDVETTSLDPRRAWLVEIAAVRLVGGRLEAAASLRRRVRPPVPIPVAATRIHGIDDAAVSGAPPFAEVWPEFSAFIDRSVVIGHALGFDLAVLERECERAGLVCTLPRTLDTRLLAELAAADLPDYSLDGVAAWLGIDATDRHSALGDALATARIFIALLPKLRERGIRTLAEAERTCRTLGNVLDAQHKAGWAEAVRAPGSGQGESGPRIDSYPYIHRVREVMSAPAKFIAPEEKVGAALERMSRERVSSLFVLPSAPDAPPRPDVAGIVTERDVLRGLAAHGVDALTLPVERITSRPLACVPADAFAHVAMGRMNRLKIRHLGATDEQGEVIGAVSARDLLRLRAEGGLLLGDEIGQSADVSALARAWAKLPRIAGGLIAEDIAARDVAALISRGVGTLTRRAAELAERRMADAGRGGPPCPYAMAVLGSAGREESLLAMDQDNALVFSAGEPDGPEDRWFGALAAHVADILDASGVPYCKGGVMAKNSQWRGSVATWHGRIEHWIRRSSPDDLLSVDIFFDLRQVSGEAGLATGIWRTAFDMARGEAAFAKLLAESAGVREAGLTWFGRIKTENGRIDLKRAGLFGIVSMARTLAIRHHVVERSTLRRLAGIEALGRGGDADLDALADAEQTFLDLVLGQQVEDIEHGRPATNRVAVARLSRRNRNRLRAALKALESVEELTRDLLP
jgi:DNA polymerase-3 subunit epsilon/CBS domain-containing protein